jgi:hypothetical protein
MSGLLIGLTLRIDHHDGSLRGLLIKTSELLTMAQHPFKSEQSMWRWRLSMTRLEQLGFEWSGSSRQRVLSGCGRAASRGTPRAAALLLWLVAAVVAGIAVGDEPIDIGSRKQLFVDSKFIERQQNIRLTMNPPVSTGELLVTADQPHEQGGLVYLYSSVLQEAGRVRLWYDLTGDEGRCVCYAESEDGLRFSKPPLGLHAIGQSAANNVVIPSVIGGGAVWIDPQAPAEHRYKTQAKAYQPTRFAMHSSPDGINWKPFTPPQLAGPMDTQSIVFWDAALGAYAMYTRQRVHEPLNYRGVRRLLSHDLKVWRDDVVVFEPDSIDLDTYRMPISAGVTPVDYYGATVFKYPLDGPSGPSLGEEPDDAVADDRVYVMLAQAFWHHTDHGFDGQLGPYTRDVRLAVSRDGERFERVGDRAAFMRPGPAGRFDSKQIWALPTPIVRGDEIWIYYAGTNVDRTARPEPENIDPATPGRQPLGGIGRAVMRLDGFVSADADYQGGELVTPPIRFSGSRLELNLDTGGGGSVRVEILDAETGEPIAGMSLEEAIPVIGNDVRLPVQWLSGHDLTAAAQRPVKLRFVMRDCKLYAFQFGP